MEMHDFEFAGLSVYRDLSWFDSSTTTSVIVPRLGRDRSFQILSGSSLLPFAAV